MWGTLDLITHNFRDGCCRPKPENFLARVFAARNTTVVPVKVTTSPYGDEKSMCQTMWQHLSCIESFGSDQRVCETIIQTCAPPSLRLVARYEKSIATAMID
jgi:hypothetical protein